MRRRHVWAAAGGYFELVSTHASVRRRHGHIFVPHCLGQSFNSRLREEATARSMITSPPPAVSTHASVRRRRLPPFLRPPVVQVSTHASVRRRLCVCCGYGYYREVSTHASVRRRRPRQVPQIRDGSVSTHASVRRRHLLIIRYSLQVTVSTHASVRRRHDGLPHRICSRASFNSRLREEATGGLYSN